MKRTLSAASISDDLFDITKYKLDCLQNLIRMINDYKCMKLPSKRRRVNYPDKMYLLPDLLPELNELNDMIGLHKFKKTNSRSNYIFLFNHLGTVLCFTQF